MKRRIVVILSVVLAVTASLLLAVAALSTYYYKNVFTFGTWINGNYCTGMTTEQVNSLLLEQYVYPSVRITMKDNKAHVINVQNFGVSADFSKKIEELLADNSGWAWITRGNIYNRYEISPDFAYEMDVMKRELLEKDWLNEDLYDKDNTVSIVKSLKDGYILIDETKNLLKQSKAIEKITNAIVNQLEMVDLTKECYVSIPYTENMRDTLSKWKGIEEFQSFSLTYDFGDKQEIIDKNVVSDWILLDEEGYIVYDKDNRPILDESMMEEYVAYLGSVYNTVGIEREFQTTRGDVVTVSGGSYGNELNAKTELQFLKKAFQNKESGVRTPEYLSKAFVKGTDDIGKTYIEIDMTNQMMYYYKGGVLKLETPVVTGNVGRGWDTPSTVCYVYYKQKNRVLRGANYATPVKYWMAVHGNIGIHDATWRDEFGGDIYLTDGSHGCVNTPLDKVQELYDMVEIGTPVIIFY